MKTRTIASAFALLACVGAAHAGQIAGSPIVGGNAAAWQTFPGALNNTSNAGRPYWDNPSMDGGNRNIGNWLNGTYTPNLPAGSVPNSGPAAPSWWGYSSPNPGARGGSTNAPSAMHFQAEAPLTYQASLLLEVAGFRNVNEVGWYDTSAAPGQEVLNPIFTGAMSPVVTTTFTPSASWGLYIRSHNGYTAASGKGWLFFMDSTRNRSVGFTGDAIPGQQHFAVFGVDTTPFAERYIVGIEDLTLNNSGIELQGDFNDVVLSIQTVPTPGTAVLGVVGGLLATRRRRNG